MILKLASTWLGSAESVLAIYLGGPYLFQWSNPYHGNLSNGNISTEETASKGELACPNDTCRFQRDENDEITSMTCISGV